MALPPESEGLINESWLAYQAHPGFVRDSQQPPDSRSAVLHAPLEPSPTGAHDAVQASNMGRSADLTALHGPEPGAAASGWSGARRRVMQVLPGRSHACGSESGLSLIHI